MQDRNKAVPSCYLILRRGDEVLLGLRRGTGYFDEHWGLPAGHVEAGEMPLAGLVREAKEEIGLDIDAADVRLVVTMYRAKADPTGERCDYFFEMTRWKGEPFNAEPLKCAEVRWFPLSALPEHMVQNHQLGLESYKAGVAYREIPLEEILPNPEV